jgi:hypothetical protein
VYSRNRTLVYVFGGFVQHRTRWPRLASALEQPTFQRFGRGRRPNNYRPLAMCRRPRLRFCFWTRMPNLRFAPQGCTWGGSCPPSDSPLSQTQY